MYQTEKIYLSARHADLTQYCTHETELAKNLYNAALFRVRQIFTGYDKERRTENERQVFQEVALLESVYPKYKVKRFISYTHLEKLMRVTKNPDFFAGLPMQSAQQILKEVIRVFKSWLAALKSFRKNPEKFTGKPKMPGYLKGNRHTLPLTNQDAVIYPEENGKAKLKLPLTKGTLPLPSYMLDKKLQEAKIQPYYDTFCISITYEKDCEPVHHDYEHFAAIDFGVDNLAAIVCTDKSCRIYKGGAIKDQNRFFNKKRAKAVSILTKGHAKKNADSRYLDRLSMKRDRFIHDQFHKISRSIIDYCIEHRVSTLVLGVNKGWKQSINLGTSNNQSFVSMPLSDLRFMITYKAALAGIVVVEQEESYTSKADITVFDYLPVYGMNDTDASFSGKRIKRGLYQCQNGMRINADCNAAANILRKAYPASWEGTDDFAFLASPDVFGFHRVNSASSN